MVEPHIKQAAHRAHRAAFCVRRAVDHPGNPGVYDGSGAHWAWLQRHIQGTLPQPPAAKTAAGIVDGLNFRVGKGVFCPLPAISAPAHDLLAPNNHAAHRHFPRIKGFLCQNQCFFHESFVHLQRLLFLYHTEIQGERQGYDTASSLKKRSDAVRGT